MFSFYVLGIMSCQMLYESCNATNICCKDLTCYENTACVYQDDVLMITKLYPQLRLRAY